MPIAAVLGAMTGVDCIAPVMIHLYRTLRSPAGGWMSGTLDMGVWNPGPAATAANDTFTGDASGEIADGLAGSDTLDGNGGNDTRSGGNGNDILRGETATT